MAFNGRYVLNIIDFASRQGADVTTLMALAGRPAEELCQESCVIENKVYNAVMEEAVRATGDEFFGLHAGENLNISAAGLIGQITQTSQTVKEALEYCCEFANLGCSVLPMQMTAESAQYKVSLTPNESWEKESPVAVKHTTEGVLAFVIREFHTSTRQNHNPVEIRLSWPAPSSETEYWRILGCPIRYNQTEIAILLKKKHVEEQVVTADYNLLRVLVAHAESKIAEISDSENFSDKIKQSIIRLTQQHFPSISDVAGHLNLTPRTLQRRLKAEGHSYKNLVDHLKKDFAVDYLKRPDLRISEIAYLLNYADTSAFTRSFKRWIGKSPNEYRKSIQ